MEGACSRTEGSCSLKRCMPDAAAAISISAARLLVPAAQNLPALTGGDLLAVLDASAPLAPPADPSDPPPRVRA